MSDRKGLVVVYTGHGKGKTTAALGACWRALGHGMRVAVVQFIKGKWKTGERAYAATVKDLEFLVMGEGFTWESEDISRDRTAAQRAWSAARGLVTSGERDLVVLDEITYAINYGFVAAGDVVATLAARPPQVHVVVTGRNAPQPIVEAADVVTEMKVVKHVYERGTKAQIGLDF